MTGTRVCLLLAVWLSLAVGAHSQMLPPKSRKPVSEAVSKALDEYALKCAPEKEKALTKHMAKVIDGINDRVKLTAEERKSLEEKAKPVVAAAVESWKGKFRQSMAGWMGNTPDKRILMFVRQWRLNDFGVNEPVEDWSMPDEAPAWFDAVRQVVGNERFTEWKKEFDTTIKKRDEEIADYLKTWVENGRKPLDTDFNAEVEDIVAALKLDAAKTEALKRSSKDLVDKVANGELARATKLFRNMTEEGRRNVFDRNYYYVGFGASSLDELKPQWTKNVLGIVGDEKVKEWEAWRKERVEREKEDMKKDVAAMALTVKESFGQVLTMEAKKISSALSLPEDRAKALEKAGEAAVEEFLKQWEAKMMETLLKETPSSRREVLNHQRGIEIDLPGSENPRDIPAWVKAKTTLITPEEQKKLKDVSTAQAARAAASHARLVIADLDQRVGFTTEQREKLEPIIAKLLQAKAPSEDSENDDLQGNTIDLRGLTAQASGLKESDIKPLLEPAQWERWQKAVKEPEDPNARRRPQVVAQKTDATNKGPNTVEGILSQHLHKLQEDERQRRYARMLVRVEEAVRIGSLPAPAAAKLETAAQGAVEISLESWITNMADWMRSQLRNATPQSVRPQLEGMGTMSMGSQLQPPDAELWKQTVAELLPTEAREKWTREQEAREHYQSDAIARTVLAEVNRRCPISDEQTAKLLPFITKIAHDYTPDLNEWYSPPWYAYGYIVCVPMAGVPEKDLKEIFPPEQLKQLKESVLEQAEQYWTNIKEMHESRVKRAR